jgi:probable F420-dependent oxidoreductase
MHVGIKIPNWGRLAGPAALAGTAAAADERGFDSIWVSDHLAMPRMPFVDYPYSGTAAPPFDADTPFVEAITSLSYAAAVSRDVQLGTGVLVLPLRSPILVAKQAASLDVLSGGRLLLGVGAGWLADEFAVLGQGWADRGHRTDEAIHVLRACWAGAEVPLPGSGGRLQAIAMNPLPARGARVPVIVGGHSATALRRAALLGDAWYASGVTAPEFGALVARLRTFDDSDDVAGDRVAVGVRPRPVEADDAAATVSAYGEAGADFVVLDANYSELTVQQAVDWVHRAADVLGLTGARRPLTARRSRATPQPLRSDG